MTARTVGVALKLPGEPETVANATVEDWSAFDRTKRAVQFLCISWAAAGVCIFFPVIHFVLVPGFLLAGPILALLKLTEHSTLRALDGPCPRCHAPGKFSVGGRFSAHRSITCDGCGNLLQMSEVGIKPTADS